MKSKKNIVYFIISLLICAAVLVYLFSEISPGQVWALITNANGNALLIFLFLSLTMSFFRTWRYKVLLNFSGQQPNPFALYLVVLIRNFCSDLLPARTGSLIYILLLKKRLGISLDQATSSFSLALAFDICSVAPLVLLATIFLGEDAGISNFIIVSAAFVFLAVSFLMIYFTPYFFNLFKRLFNP